MLSQLGCPSDRKCNSGRGTSRTTLDVLQFQLVFQLVNLRLGLLLVALRAYALGVFLLVGLLKIEYHRWVSSQVALSRLRDCDHFER